MGKSRTENADSRLLLHALVCMAAALGGCRQQESTASPASDIDPMGPGGNQIVNLSVINMLQPPEEVERLKQRALSGDNRAAYDLANHYSQAGPSREELRWLTVGANRGDCAAMSLLLSHAERVGDRQGSRRWNDLMRQHVCTWGKAYPGSSVPDPTIPLWRDD